uniref:Nucleoside phosphorylase n=1 Tax=Pithovirus LCPAC401 TaxID=2506595 RepID=A0A481ZA92_9VIRU|nr:MAG: hypothetical protein LCPAC401_00230 [Pithovirus LCPAC401]
MKVLILTNTALENNAVEKVWDGILERSINIGTFPNFEGKMNNNTIAHVHIANSYHAIPQLINIVNPDTILFVGELIGRCNVTKCGDIIIANEIVTSVDNALESCNITHSMKANCDVFQYIADDSKNIKVHMGQIELSSISQENRSPKEWLIPGKLNVIGVDIGTMNVYTLIRSHNELTKSKIDYLLVKGVSNNGTQPEGANEQNLKRIAAERSADWILQFCKEAAPYLGKQ